MAVEAQIPSFVKARSPEGLRRSMLANNAKHGMFFKYFDIQFDGKNWFAWFFMDFGSGQALINEMEAEQAVKK